MMSPIGFKSHRLRKKSAGQRHVLKKQMCDLPTSAQFLPIIPPSQDDHRPSSAVFDAVKVTESQGARSLAGDVPLEVPMRESSPDTPYGN